jgi:hypothetical protein
MTEEARRRQPAEINYLDHAQIAAAVPIVSPQQMGGVA